MIPTEFGELINLTNLELYNNKLSGTPSLLILAGVVVRVYHCNHVVVVVVRGGGSAGGVASGDASHRERKDVLRLTFCVVPTWRTGQEEFKAFMDKKRPSCRVIA